MMECTGMPVESNSTTKRELSTAEFLESCVPPTLHHAATSLAITLHSSTRAKTRFPSP